MKNHFRTMLWPLMATMLLVVTVPPSFSQAGDHSSAPAPAATGPGERDTANPPISGLDKPVSEPIFGGRSYVLPGVQLSQSVDGYTGGGTYAVTRALGSLDLQKIWKRSQFDLDYIGGGTVYEGTNIGGNGAYQTQSMAATERILWRTGQLAIRDSFDYLPEGAFGFSSFGGAGAFDPSGGLGGLGPGSGIGSGLSGSASTGGFGGVDYGSIGIQPRIDNSSIIDVTQALSARSSVTLAGGFSVGHYLDRSSSPFPLFNNEQTTAQVGYNRQFTARDQFAVNYAFGQFRYPGESGAGSIRSQSWTLMYGHRITGRLNFVVGGGPQLLDIVTPASTFQLLGLTVTVPANQLRSISGTGTATLDYTVSSRTSVNLNYGHFVTAGSGYFAGAKTDSAGAGVSHLFARRWTTNTNVGYSRNSNLQKGFFTTAVSSNIYHYWYGGTSLRRQIGRHFDGFVSYQFSSFSFVGCTASLPGCGSTGRSHNGVIGLEWHPDPWRWD